MILKDQMTKQKIINVIDIGYGVKGVLGVHLDLIPKILNKYRLCSQTNTQIYPKKQLTRCTNQFELIWGLLWAL